MRPTVGNGGEDSNEVTGRRLDKYPTSSYGSGMGTPSKFKNNLPKNNIHMRINDDEIQL
jgi:hypothetical protein